MFINNSSADTYVDSRQVCIAQSVWFGSLDYSLAVRMSRYKVHEHEFVY